MKTNLKALKTKNNSSGAFKPLLPKFIHHRTTLLINSGFSMLETLMVLGMSGILLGIGMANFKILDDPLQNATAQSGGFIKQVRAKAISSTLAYKIVQLGDSALIAKTGPSCYANPTEFFDDPKFILNLDPRVLIMSGAFEICFNSRGIANWNGWLTLGSREDLAKWRDLEITLAGGIKIHKPIT